MKKIVIGGVPEHFNLPWHLAMEEGVFADLNVEVQWREFPDGTGAMMKAVDAGEVDIALVLTEGAVAHIGKNQTTAIIGTWVESPLVWGVHGAHGTNPTPNFPHDSRIAISRPGSGSHLMPLVHARQEKWNSDLSFVEIGTLKGAIEGFANNTIDAFYWERTMTWPECNAGQMTLNGVFSAPWPAFVAVTRKDRADDVADAWTYVIAQMANFTLALIEDRSRFLNLVSEKFHIPLSEIEAWFGRTTFKPSVDVTREGLSHCVNELVAAGILPTYVEVESLIASPARLV